MIVESMSEDEILRIANPIMDNLMDASTAIDHARHIRDFTERMKAIVTKEYLQKVCEKYQQEKGYSKYTIENILRDRERCQNPFPDCGTASGPISRRVAVRRLLRFPTPHLRQRWTRPTIKSRMALVLLVSRRMKSSKVCGLHLG
jgi:hypothetical protein